MLYPSHKSLTGTGAHCYGSNNLLLWPKCMRAHCYKSTNLLLEHQFTGAYCYKSIKLQEHRSPIGAQKLLVFLYINLKIDTIYMSTKLQKHKYLTGAQNPAISFGITIPTGEGFSN